MKRYRVVIKGDNFLLLKEGKLGKFGFLVPCFVEAHTKEEAEANALIMVGNDPKLDEMLKNDIADPPAINIDETKEIGNAKGTDIGKPGYIFFPIK